MQQEKHRRNINDASVSAVSVNAMQQPTVLLVSPAFDKKVYSRFTLLRCVVFVLLLTLILIFVFTIQCIIKHITRAEATGQLICNYSDID